MSYQSKKKNATLPAIRKRTVAVSRSERTTKIISVFVEAAQTCRNENNPIKAARFVTVRRLPPQWHVSAQEVVHVAKIEGYLGPRNIPLFDLETGKKFAVQPVNVSVAESRPVKTETVSPVSFPDVVLPRTIRFLNLNLDPAAQQITKQDARYLAGLVGFLLQYSSLVVTPECLTEKTPIAIEFQEGWGKDTEFCARMLNLDVFNSIGKNVELSQGFVCRYKETRDLMHLAVHVTHLYGTLLPEIKAESQPTMTDAADEPSCVDQVRKAAADIAAPNLFEKPLEFRYIIFKNNAAFVKNGAPLTLEQANVLSDLILWLPTVLKQRRLVNVAIFQVGWIKTAFHNNFGAKMPDIQDYLKYLGVLSSPGGKDFTLDFIRIFNEQHDHLLSWAKDYKRDPQAALIVATQSCKFKRVRSMGRKI